MTSPVDTRRWKTPPHSLTLPQGFATRQSITTENPIVLRRAPTAYADSNMEILVLLSRPKMLWKTNFSRANIIKAITHTERRDKKPKRSARVGSPRIWHALRRPRVDTSIQSVDIRSRSIWIKKRPTEPYGIRGTEWI